jgi:hypothetical protein
VYAEWAAFSSCHVCRVALNKIELQVQDTYLSTMFGGDWEQNLTRDYQGHVLLEFDPSCFRMLLNKLMHDRRHINDNTTLEMPKNLQEEQEQMYQEMVRTWWCNVQACMFTKSGFERL